MLRAADDFPTFFTPADEFPLIIDCGANIGVSILEWKYRWPTCRIICFEPDPYAFALLQKNVIKNDLPGVQCFCTAISDQSGEGELFGQIGHGADSRGNSLRPEWGDREDSDLSVVRCERLGPYLSEEKVSFLKLDIEGMEEAVLRDIFPLLKNVDSAYIEVHSNAGLLDRNDCRRIEKILTEANFSIETESRFPLHAFPEQQRDWQQSTQANQHQILCWR